MPNTKRNIADIARDYADGTEVAAAIKAGMPIAPTQDKSREAWLRRWLELSEWARMGELKDLDRELTETLEEIRLGSEVTERQATEAMYVGCHADTSFRQLVEGRDPNGNSELVQRFAETKLARDNALEAAGKAAKKRSDYAEAQGVVTLAQMRSQVAHHYFAEMRRVRVRAVASTILVVLVILALAALVVHFRVKLL